MLFVNMLRAEAVPPIIPREARPVFLWRLVVQRPFPRDHQRCGSAFCRAAARSSWLPARVEPSASVATSFALLVGWAVHTLP